MKTNKATLVIAIGAILAILSACSNMEDQKNQDNTMQARELTAEEYQAYAYQNAITDVLQQHDTIQKSANGNEVVAIAEMRTINLTACPTDFATAYMNHIHARERATQIQGVLEEFKRKKSLGKAVLEEWLLSNNAVNNTIETERELEASASRAHNLITNSFNEVERIAVSYGARLPGQTPPPPASINGIIMS